MDNLLWAAPIPNAAMAGASDIVGGGVRVQPKGLSLIATHTFTFAPRRLVHQLVRGLFFLMEAPMQKQLELPLLGRIDGADIVPPSLLKTAQTYRQAVRLCWALRRTKSMNATDFARAFDFNRQHIGDYLNNDDKPKRRNLPPGRISDFEDGCGNAAISQWLASRQKLTVLEELQAERAVMEARAA